jgi:arylsulfatase A-like enzyme
MWHQPSDDAVSRHLLKATAGNSRFVFAQFPAVDGFTHQSGADSAPVHRALARLDETVGRLRQQLTTQGQIDSSLILLVSDHGASAVHTHLDLADWFRGRGVPTLAHPIIWEKNPRAAVMVAGNGSAMVYARPGEPRQQRWPMERLRKPETFDCGSDIMASLLREPSVAFIAAESERGGLRIESAAGAATITLDAGEIVYQPRSGDPLLLGGPQNGTSRQWLEATWDSAFPDAPFHLLDQFRSRRAGDLLVIGSEGYDFRGRFELPEHRWGHGSLTRSHMQTPVWSSHPIPPVPLRTVDLFPAMLRWLGVTVPAGIDGESVWLPAEHRPVRKPARAACPAPERPRSVLHPVTAAEGGCEL